MGLVKSVRVAARVAMQKFGYDPLEVLVKHAQSSAANADTSKEIAMFLMSYMYPKLSNVTVEGEIASTVTQSAQAALLQKVLENPELVDAAQRLSVAAAESMLDNELFGQSEMIN